MSGEQTGEGLDGVGAQAVTPRETLETHTQSAGSAYRKLGVLGNKSPKYTPLSVIRYLS